MYNKGGSKSYPKKSDYVPAPQASLLSGADREVWMDLVTAALHGFSSTMWQDNNGMRPNTASTASKAACEAADIVFAEWKLRFVQPVKTEDTEQIPF